MDKFQRLLKDYSLEDILERVGLEPRDVLEGLIIYGYIKSEDLDTIVEATDGEA